MASTIKFTHAAMSAQNRHIAREHANPSNAQIDSERTHLNYSFPTGHDSQRPYAYYKQRIDEVYMYGRGTQREKDAITGCGWVVTLPKELCGNTEKEKAFFQGVYDFISNRYGSENIITNAVHRDEGGSPHLHVIILPVTELNHDMVQFKTKRTKQAVQLESGRWEYKHIHIDSKGKPADENDPSTWVPLNNYARMSDYYNEKVDCNSVLNPIELRHFHSDLQQYLIDHGIEGKVVTGKSGLNFSVKELKDFTSKTGMHLDEVKEMIQDDKSLLESFIESDAKIAKLEEILHEKEALIETLQQDLFSKNVELNISDEVAQKDKQITELSRSISTKDQELLEVFDRNIILEKKLAEMEVAMTSKQAELEETLARVNELEEEKSNTTSQTDGVYGWGQSASSWGEKSQTGWGSNTTTIDEEKTW